MTTRRSTATEVTGIDLDAAFDTATGQTSLPERTVRVFFNADLLADIEALDRDLTRAQTAREAEANRSQRNNGNPQRRMVAAVPAEEKALAEQIQQLREELEKSGADIRVRAMAGPDWRALKRRHANDEGFDAEALLDEGNGIRDSIVAPKMTESRWAKIKALPDGEWTRLGLTVLELNQSTVSVPFSRAASNALRNSNGT